jgi:hypothetical protein
VSPPSPFPLLAPRNVVKGVAHGDGRSEERAVAEDEKKFRYGSTQLDRIIFSTQPINL